MPGLAGEPRPFFSAKNLLERQRLVSGHLGQAPPPRHPAGAFKAHAAACLHCCQQPCAVVRNYTGSVLRRTEAAKGEIGTLPIAFYAGLELICLNLPLLPACRGRWKVLPSLPSSSSSPQHSRSATP